MNNIRTIIFYTSHKDKIYLKTKTIISLTGHRGDDQINHQYAIKFYIVRILPI
jgi:hypothetical protein